MQSAKNVAVAKAFAEDPGNWSALDGRRDMLLEVCEAYEELLGEVEGLKKLLGGLHATAASEGRQLGYFPDRVNGLLVEGRHLQA